jgi:hypothetical protein
MTAESYNGAARPSHAALSLLISEFRSQGEERPEAEMVEDHREANYQHALSTASEANSLVADQTAASGAPSLAARFWPHPP